MPNPLSTTPTLDEVISWALDTRLGQMFFALPGIIRSYNPSEQLANIQPLIKHNVPRADGGEFVQDVPLLQDVPVIFPRGGTYFISFPLKVGDKVLLVFCDRNIDQYIRKTNVSDAVVDPFDLDISGLNGAVALPGFYRLQNALASSDASPSNLVIGKEGGNPQIHLKDNGEVHIGVESAPDFVALAAKVLTELNKLHSYLSSLNTVITGAPIPETGLGSPSALQTALKAAAAGSPLQTPSSVAAEKVKAK